MKDERVEIFIPRASDREDPNLFAAVNGVNYLLPRQEVMCAQGRGRRDRAQRPRRRYFLRECRRDEEHRKLRRRP